jgi:hypothetical protein
MGRQQQVRRRRLRRAALTTGNNLRRGHYAITADLPEQDRARVAFEELVLAF